MPPTAPSAQLADPAFRGVNARLDPALLDPGYVAHAVNYRFTQGICEPRKGTLWSPWLCPTPSSPDAWTSPKGIGVYSDPRSGLEYLILAAGNALYALYPHNAPITLPVPASLVLPDQVSFTQCFDTLICHRGPTLPALAMPSVQAGFEYVTQSAAGDGTAPIPNTTHGLFFQNRLVLPTTHDTLVASDLGDYTRYAPASQEFRINTGAADQLVTIAPFGPASLVVLKTASVHFVANFYGDLQALQRQTLTTQYGCVARKTVLQVGADLWFLSTLGLMSVKLTDQNQLQGVDLPISDPIEPIIRRINWRYAGNACAAYWNNRVYLAVPLDGSTTNNVILVYDLLNQAWAGYDESPFLTIQDLITYQYMGEKRLFLLTTDGYLYLYEETYSDATPLNIAQYILGFDGLPLLDATGTPIKQSTSA